MKTRDEILWEDWDALKRILGDDVLRLEGLLDAQDSQMWRRSYCRALFALIEATAEWMKRYTIHYNYPEILGESEKKNLESRNGVLLGIFAALDLFTDTAGAATPLQKGGKEWIALQTAVRIRNRVTHPKSARDAGISDAELQHLFATKWVFGSLVMDCLRDSASALERDRQDIQRVWEGRNGPIDSVVPTPTQRHGSLPLTSN